MIKLLCIFFAGVALSFSNSQADPLAVGSTAPALVAPDQDGKPVDFGQVYAQGITLVYFYPKAGTSGCTAEACSLRDSYDKLTGQGLHIIGVSRDTASDQKKFKTENQIPFKLVADPEGTVAKAFGVPSIPLINLDSRVSFIVKNGKIAWSSLHAQTKGSAKEVQVALDSLKS
jgi:peroxiredoxin Q/BCP